MKPSPQIVGIGVGEGISVDKLRNILPGQRVFSENNYSGLNTALKEFTEKKVVEPAVRLIFHPSDQSTLQKSRQDLTINFSVEPDSELTCIPKGSEIRFLPNPFFHGENVTIDEDAFRERPVTGSVTLKVKPLAVHYGTFPERIYYEAHIPGSARGKYRGNVSMLLGWLAGDFIDQDEPDTNVNILIWGSMGCGKSSFINGIINLFRADQNIEKSLITARSDGHVTTSYSRNAIGDFLNENSNLENNIKQQLKINLWDTWGVTPNNYNNLRINHFLEGRVYEGTLINDLDSAGDNEPDPNAIIDAVIILIPIGTPQKAGQLEKLQKHITSILQKGIRPIIVINFLNTLSSEEEIEEEFKEILKASHLSANDLFKLDNYDNEDYRNMSKDLEYWKILQSAFNQAKLTRIRRRRQKAGSGIGSGIVGGSPVKKDASPKPKPGAQQKTAKGSKPALLKQQGLVTGIEKRKGTEGPQLKILFELNGARPVPVKANSSETLRSAVEDLLESVGEDPDTVDNYRLEDREGSFISMRKRIGDILTDSDLVKVISKE